MSRSSKTISTPAGKPVGQCSNEGRLCEAWRYLQATGQRAEVAAALAKVAVDENNVEQLVEVALYDGVAPELGFHHLLAHYGVCNAITAIDTVVFRLPLSVRQTTAAMLVRQLYGELMANIRREFDDRQELLPAGATLGQLVTSRTDLFAGQGCHVDASHLAAVVRHAEALEDLETIQLRLRFANMDGCCTPPASIRGMIRLEMPTATINDSSQHS